MQEGVQHHSSPSLLPSGKEVQSAAGLTSEDTATASARVEPRASSAPALHPDGAAPGSGLASAAAGETDHSAEKVASSPRGISPSTRDPKTRSVTAHNNNNNNGQGMKCLGALDCNMKANERYFLLNKNTFQEIFDATLHEMTGAATPVTRRGDTSLTQSVEGSLDRERASPRQSSTSTPRDRHRSSSSTDSSKRSLSAAKKNASSPCLSQSAPRDYEPSTTTHRKITVEQYPGMTSIEAATTDSSRPSPGIFSSRMTALNDITNDHHGTLMTSSRTIPTATQSTAPNHFLPLVSPLDIESENEPLDLTVCRRPSKSSSVDSKSQSNESSAPGSPVNLVRTDRHSRSGEVQNTGSASDKKSLSDNSEEEIDLVEVESTCSSGGGNGDGSTYRRKTDASSASRKHSTSDERGGPVDGCWQPTGSAPTEPRLGGSPRGTRTTTTHTHTPRSIAESSATSTTTAIPHKSGTKGKDIPRCRSESAMTGVFGGMAATRIKPRATENWAALSKTAVYNLVEEMVLKMDEEESSEASRSPRTSTPETIRKSDSSSKLSDRSGRPSSRQRNTNSPLQAEPADEQRRTPGSGRSRFVRSNNPTSASKSVMQSYDQSLSPSSPSQQAPPPSPRSVPPPAHSRAQLMKSRPGRSGMGKTTNENKPERDPDNEGGSSEHSKQCWVALNKRMVFDIVETAIESEAKESNNNVRGAAASSTERNIDSRSTTPDSVSSRNSSTNVVVDDEVDDEDQMGSTSQKNVSGANHGSDGNSRKRKCDSSSSAPSHTSSSGKYAKQTARDFPHGLERVSMNDSCTVPKRPRSSDCTSGDINTDISPPKQRRKSAEINRSYSSEAFFDGSSKPSDAGQKKAKEGERELESGTRPSHDRTQLHHRPIATGQSMRFMSSVAGQQRSASTKSRSSAALGNSKRKLHSGGSPTVYDLSLNNASNITHLVQSQRTPIDYGRNTGHEKILAAKQANTKKLDLHSSTSPAHQASAAAIRSRGGVPVNNNQYHVLDDTRDNNGDRKKRSKFDNGTLKEFDNGLGSGSRPVSLCSSEEGVEAKDARSSPRLGWVAVSKADVHNLFNSVVDSMMASEVSETEEAMTSRRNTSPSTELTRTSGGGSGARPPAPPGGARTSSPANSTTSSGGDPGTGSSSGSSPRRQQVDCESGSNRVDNERGGPCSPPSPSSKPGYPRTHSPSGSSDNLDSEHVIVDPGSPGDMFPDTEGKDNKSNKSKTFKWKSNLLMRVHEQSQTAVPFTTSSNSPSSESTSSDKSDNGLVGQSSSTPPAPEAPSRGRQQNTSARSSSRRSEKKGTASHSHRAK